MRKEPVAPPADYVKPDPPPAPPPKRPRHRPCASVAQLADHLSLANRLNLAAVAVSRSDVQGMEALPAALVLVGHELHGVGEQLARIADATEALLREDVEEVDS